MVVFILCELAMAPYETEHIKFKIFVAYFLYDRIVLYNNALYLILCRKLNNSSIGYAGLRFIADASIVIINFMYENFARNLKQPKIVSIKICTCKNNFFVFFVD